MRLGFDRMIMSTYIKTGYIITQHIVTTDDTFDRLITFYIIQTLQTLFGRNTMALSSFGPVLYVADLLLA